MGVIIRRQLKLDRLKNDFISNITHELRTPLTILRSTNEAIARFNVATDPEKLARYTGINADIINKLDGHVERIMDISMIDRDLNTKETQAVDLNTLLENLFRHFQAIENNQITLNFRGPKQLVNTDPYKLETILSNLLDNALKYAGPEASIFLEAVIGHRSWQLIVSDTGVGISAEDLPYIFDRFFRVNNGDLHDVKGYGLGLSQVKSMVEALNGNIKANSKIGRGTTFIITFPL
nr:HAMP domain-containing sensor histidine kinase [Mucilaginibacter sp. Bleaf8]